MSNRIEITMANSGDSMVLRELLLQQFDEHGIRVEESALLTAVAGVLHNEDYGFFLLARTADVVVGMAYVAFNWSLEHCGKSGWLEELYVAPEWRNRGIGQELLSAVFTRSRASGCAAIDLEVDRGHSRAESLYSRTHFRALPRSRWVKDLIDGA